MTHPDPGTPSPAPLPAPHDATSPAARAALDAGRERAIRLLTDRFADDTLTVEEFEARLDRMYQAVTPADLDALTSDLVGVTGEGAARRAPGQGPPFQPQRPPYPAPDETPALRRVLAIMSESKQTGRWVVPRKLAVAAVMGDLLLDLRDAALPPGFCEIDLVAVMSNVKILVPPGVVVEGLLTSIMAAFGNDAEDYGRQPASTVYVRLTGLALMAEVRVRVAPPGEPPKRAWRQARHRG